MEIQRGLVPLKQKQGDRAARLDVRLQCHWKSAEEIFLRHRHFQDKSALQQGSKYLPGVSYEDLE